MADYGGGSFSISVPYTAPQMIAQAGANLGSSLSEAFQQYHKDKQQAAFNDAMFDYLKNVPGAVPEEALARYHSMNANQKNAVILAGQFALKDRMERDEQTAKNRLALAHANYLTGSAAAQFAGAGGGPGGVAPKGKIWSDELSGWATPAQADAARRRTPGSQLLQNYAVTPQQIYDSKQHEAGRWQIDPKTGNKSFINDATGDQIRIGGPTGAVMPKETHEYYKRILGGPTVPGPSPNPASAVGQPQAPAAGSPAGTGTVRVISPQGVAGTIPANRLQEALNNGYRQAGGY